MNGSRYKKGRIKRGEKRRGVKWERAQETTRKRYTWQRLRVRRAKESETKLKRGMLESRGRKSRRWVKRVTIANMTTGKRKEECFKRHLESSGCGR